MTRLGVLGSGKGSNFRAIAEAIDRGDLRRKSAWSFPMWKTPASSSSRELADSARSSWLQGVSARRWSRRLRLRVVEVLREARVDLVVLAGYLRMIKAPLLEAFPRRIVNIHPSLLPQFPGLAAWEQALAAGVPATGCTVHFVDGGMDTGEVLGQREVAIHADDTPASLHARIQAEEHVLYPEIISRLLGRERGPRG